jgi:ParB family chromosome partitioning protein
MSVTEQKDNKFSAREYLDGAGKAGSVVLGQEVKIPLDKIAPNPWQPRKTFRKVPLEELAASIKERGVLHAITVRRSENPEAEAVFEIVIGERRWRAARMAGLSEIPAIIKDVADGDMLTDALIENIQREEMTFLDTIRGCIDLREKFGSLDEVAKRISRDRTTVTKYCKTFEEIHSLPDITALFERQTLDVDRATAENFARVAGDIRRLQKSNKREYDRIVRRLAKEKAGGIRTSIPWLLSKFKKAQKVEPEAGHKDGMFKETDTEIALRIKIKKGAGLSHLDKDEIKRNMDIFSEKMDAIPEIARKE